MRAIAFAVAVAGCGAPPVGVRFVDVSDSAIGVRAHGVFGELDAIGLGRGGGAAIADFDGDGKLDLLLAFEQPVLLLGDAALHFRDAAAAVLDGKRAMGVGCGDLDGDGDPDCILTSPDGDVWLLRNDGGALVDAGAGSGLPATVAPYFSESPLVADLDHDGRDDVYLPILGDPRNATMAGFAPKNILYMGDGALHFAASPGASDQYGGGPAGETLVAALFPVEDSPGALALIDLNDTFITPPDYTTALPGTFGDRVLVEGADAGDALGLAGTRSSMGAAAGDVDGDGALDLATSDIARNHLWLRRGARFTDEADARGAALFTPGVPTAWSYWGIRLLDLDRDGDLDLLVQGGRLCPLDGGCQSAPMQGTRYLQNDGGRFSPTSVDGDFLPGGVPILGRALVTGDLDGDGDDDVLVCPFADRYRLFRNDSTAPPPLRVHLRGTVSSPDADGARVVYGAQVRALYGGGAILSTSERVVDLAYIAGQDLEVDWPSGFVELFHPTSAGSVAFTEHQWMKLSKPTARADGSDAIDITLDGVGGVFADGKPLPLTWVGDPNGNGVQVAHLTSTTPGNVTLTFASGARLLPARRVVTFTP